MAEITSDIQVKILDNFSTGIQRKSSRFQQRDADVNVAENASFDLIGGISKKKGYSQKGSDLTSTTSTSTSTSTTSTSSSTTSSTSTSSSTSTTTTA